MGGISVLGLVLHGHRLGTSYHGGHHCIHHHLSFKQQMITRKIPFKIISGGQTGADIGALDFAIEHGIEHGGHCPAGRRSENGPIPDKYRLVETKTRDYPERTELNVVNSTATLIFSKASHKSRGSELTRKLCIKHDRPHFVVSMVDGQLRQEINGFREWLVANGFTQGAKVLNVAGHRESSLPGIHDWVVSFLTSALVLD